MEMNEEDLVLDPKVGSTMDVDQDLTRIHNQDREDQDEDLMIHHAPVQLGGGPKLQLLSQPEPEVVKTFLSKALPFLLVCKQTNDAGVQINAKEGNLLSLECEVAGVKPIGKLPSSLSSVSVLLTSDVCCNAGMLVSSHHHHHLHLYSPQMYAGSTRGSH